MIGLKISFEEYWEKYMQRSDIPSFRQGDEIKIINHSNIWSYKQSWESAVKDHHLLLQDECLVWRIGFKYKIEGGYCLHTLPLYAGTEFMQAQNLCRKDKL